MTPISSNTGKIIPAKIPIFRLSPKAPDTIPTNVGPPEQPISPPNASNANMAVPPLGKAADSPQTAQAIRFNSGIENNEIPK